MTIFQAHQTFFCELLEKTGDKNEARAGARLLIDNLSGAAHAHLTQPHRVLPASSRERFETVWAELKNNRPLPYILGSCEFYNLVFHCDERALIPRPETELLVDFALNSIADRGARIADLGTGTGCVAISIAANCESTQIFATDISIAALELARENAALHKVAPRIQFIAGARGDWAAPLWEYSQSGGFDVIISNPPYIAPRDIENLQMSVKNFEPRVALDGGEDGLDCYRQIAAQCGALLKPGGSLACELGAGQFADARFIFEKENWRVQKPVLDFAGIERVLVANPRT